MIAGEEVAAINLVSEEPGEASSGAVQPEASEPRGSRALSYASIPLHP